MATSSGAGLTCGDAGGTATTSHLFGVGPEVGTGRLRIVQGKARGPWLNSAPDRGLVHLELRLTGEAAVAKDVTAEFELLDRSGRPVEVELGNGKVGRRLVVDVDTCAGVKRQGAEVPPVGQPADDADGIRTCQTMAEESADNEGTGGRGAWRSRLVVSTAGEWGAVLSDGERLVGCSLAPTQEISPFTPDEPTIEKSSFFFALNPVGNTGASSLWAAGRVPADVTAISYGLPGGRDVAATIGDDGYWMLKHHTEPGAAVGEPDDGSAWPPVVVSVTRASGAVRHTIPFTEETMCRQVSHGC